MITLEITIDKLDENTMLQNDKEIQNERTMTNDKLERIKEHQAKMYWKIVRAIQRARISGEIE